LATFFAAKVSFLKGALKYN